ncbi:MAG TPA: rhomboid family intramembrane serine protease [Candidatus Thermoplasmatota archaeon]|nr:rhomboid family intramembrane serine protease [Candidatus Thermoplasmatota archaeon]
MPGKCDQCGVEEYMPYVCKFCRGRYCAAHRLPENHDCQGLGLYREKMRAEGRVMAPEPGVVRPTMSAGARAGMSLDAMWAKLEGKMTYVFLGIMVSVFVIQLLMTVAGASDLEEAVFVITPEWTSRPWTVITSIFAHGSVTHLMLNGLVLLFFGQTTERLIGTRRFTWLFLGAGAIGGVAQVVLTQMLFHVESGGLGASGAIQGVMGTLVVLAPRLTVLVFFVIPAPLWALTIFYVLLDLVGVITPGSQIGHIAHLAGLGVGLLVGYYLRQQGLRTVVTRPPPMERRYF